MAWSPGSRPELEKACSEYGGHALALTLLGKYLVAACRGDIRRRERISSGPAGQLSRIVEGYEDWLKDKPELSVLRLLGLFDRPAEAGALAALRALPPIEGLTSALEGLSEEDWSWAVNQLRAARILDPEDPEQPDTLDCDPLVLQALRSEAQAGFTGRVAGRASPAVRVLQVPGS